MAERQPRAGSPPALPAPAEDRGFGWRVVETTAIVLGVLLLLTSLLLFAAVLIAAVLIATLLHAATNGLVRATSLADGLALALVVSLVTGGLIALGWVLVPRLIEQLPELVDSLADTLAGLHEVLGPGRGDQRAGTGSSARRPFAFAGRHPGRRHRPGLVDLRRARQTRDRQRDRHLSRRDPELYLRGVTRLLPRDKRASARGLLETLGHTLRWWMVGQLISMTAVGLLSYGGLRLLGVPLALILAMVAFPLTFIPSIGPLLSAIPVVLVAFSQSPTLALCAFLLYSAIQLFEGYVLTPNVQRRSVSLPPALTIVAQVLLGILVGALGVTLATPLAAAGMVGNRLYVEEVLEEDQPAPAVAPLPSRRAAADGSRGRRGVDLLMGRLIR